uniref:Uncharacterized protein n=1 Tax=Anopheles christyi TaxID=43041 RepID=A0A182KIZ1_9DIPT
EQLVTTIQINRVLREGIIASASQKTNPFGAHLTRRSEREHPRRWCAQPGRPASRSASWWRWQQLGQHAQHKSGRPGQQHRSGGHGRGSSIGNLLGQDGLGIGVLGQLVGDAGVRLADARERGIDGLRVVRDGSVVRADRALVRGTDGRAGHDGLSDRGSSVHLRGGVDLRGSVRDGL